MPASESRKLRKTEKVSGGPGLLAALAFPRAVFSWGNPEITDHPLGVSW